MNSIDDFDFSIEDIKNLSLNDPEIKPISKKKVKTQTGSRVDITIENILLINEAIMKELKRSGKYISKKQFVNELIHNSLTKDSKTKES